MGGVDLFTPEMADGALSVSQLTRAARRAVEGGLGGVWVVGEVSGLKRYQSGHWYFGLRDERSQVRCVMWRSDNQRLPAAPADGTRVYCLGEPTVWEERGEFRLTVRELLSTDVGGAWQIELERARKALERDGLLDPARKRRLPRFPRCVAVVTSRDAAALQDVRSVLSRRWPLAEVVVIPTLVQGEQAERDLVRALRAIARTDADVAILTRGGGSREDLWVFNSERVARELASAPVPTISAIGHETDVTLCDLVADHRAPTPSAAAEHAVPDRLEVRQIVDHLARRAAGGLERRLRLARERLARSGDRMSTACGHQVALRGERIEAFAGRLDALSPLRVLSRGYAVAQLEPDGRAARSADQLPPGTAFRVRLADGSVRAESLGPA